LVDETARLRPAHGAGRRRAGGGTHGASYVERRCALRWQLVTWGLGLPAALVAVFVALAIFVSPDWFVAAAITPLLAPFMMGIGLLYRNWPTGIRIDEAGVSIGAVGSRRAMARRPTVTHQNWALFTCPWPSVRYLTVVTDPARIREIKKSPQYLTVSNRWGKPHEMTRCMAGVLTAPFMTAALVIGVGHEEAGVVSPELRPARFYSRTTGASRLTAGPAVEWVAPTRHPDEMRTFLAAIGHSPRSTR